MYKIKFNNKCFYGVLVFVNIFIDIILFNLRVIYGWCLGRDIGVRRGWEMGLRFLVNV